MANVVAKYAAKKMLSKQLQQYKDKDPAGPYDPYYEFRTDPRKPNGKKRKMKKQIPAYIPEHDADVLANVRKTAYRLDCSLFTLFGIRFGWSSVIGLVPAAGDVLDGAMAMNTVRKCNKVEGGLPKAVVMQMLFWVFVDFIVGLVPFVGDLLDASIKANSKNCRILEQHLDDKYKPKSEVEKEKQRRANARKSNMPYEEPAPATVYEDMSDDDAGLPQYEERPPTNQYAAGANGASAPLRPEPVRVPDERRGGTNTRKPEAKAGNNLFGGGRSSSKRQRDVEMGGR